MEKIEYSYGAIIYKENNILLIKHKMGHWSFPKGHIEKNETGVMTALREIKEETNLSAIIDENFCQQVVYSPKKNVKKYVTYYAGFNPKGDVKVQKEEVDTYKWLSLDKALDLITYDNDREILKKFIIFLNKKKDI